MRCGNLSKNCVDQDFIDHLLSHTGDYSGGDTVDLRIRNCSVEHFPNAENKFIFARLVH